MFALPGILTLVIFCIVRPFELFEALRGLPFLYVACAIAVLGYLLDLRTGLIEAAFSKSVRLALMWLVWVALATALAAPAALGKQLPSLVILYTTFFLVANAIRTVGGLEKIAGVVLICVVWICIVCVHQSMQPLQCVYFDPDSPSLVFPTGEWCMEKSNCEVNDEAFRDCSKIGLFGVGSVGDRVRYTGILQDPNEVAMFAASSLPLAIAFTELKPTFGRKLALALTALLVIITVHATGSRGGLLVLAAVIVTYTIRKLGVSKGVLALAPFALMGLAVLMGSPSRDDAEDSTEKRLGCMLAGTEMLLRSPLFGVGSGQYTQFHDQTAHNAYILVAAETGFFGLVLWATVSYVVLKGVFEVTMLGRDDPRARIWGTALATSLVGFFVGIFFLSFSYHLVLWIFYGMATALHNACGKKGGPRVSPKELAGIVVVCLLTMIAIHIYASSG